MNKIVLFILALGLVGCKSGQSTVADATSQKPAELSRQAGVEIQGAQVLAKKIVETAKGLGPENLTTVKVTVLTLGDELLGRLSTAFKLSTETGVEIDKVSGAAQDLADENARLKAEKTSPLRTGLYWAAGIFGTLFFLLLGLTVYLAISGSKFWKTTALFAAISFLVGSVAAAIAYWFVEFMWVLLGIISLVLLLVLSLGAWLAWGWFKARREALQTKTTAIKIVKSIDVAEKLGALEGWDSKVTAAVSAVQGSDGQRLVDEAQGKKPAGVGPAILESGR